MKPYDMIVTCLFLAVAVACFWGAVRAYQTAKASGLGADGKWYHGPVGKALPWVAGGGMFLLAALYIVFRNSWFALGASLVGFAAFGYVVGTGIRDNMMHHS